LEGIQAEIPVIFRLKDNSLPEVPHKAKILLKGTWSESENSSRPSFTCQEYQILSPPFQPTTKDLKEQISQLLTTSLKKLGE
jgi:hypothetical protein